MSDKLIVRMSRNIFLTDKKYTVKISENEETYILNSKNNKIEINLSRDANTIEISNSKISKIFLINKSDNPKFLNVYPNLTFELALGIFIGFAVIASLVILFLSLTKGVNLVLIFITFLPLFFLKRKNFEDGFEIKELKQ